MGDKADDVLCFFGLSDETKIEFYYRVCRAYYGILLQFWIVYNSNDEEVFETVYCYNKSLVLFMKR